MDTKFPKSIRVYGNAGPAYLNGRPRAMLIEAFGSTAAPQHLTRATKLQAELKTAA